MTDGNEPTLFERIGGSAVVDIMVERFYDNMDSMPEAAGIRAMHHPDLGPVREVLKRYFTEWLGGPPLYSTERGHPRLRMRHMHVSIGIAERDAWLLCMRGALDDAVSDDAAREDIYRALSGLADHMRNKDEA